MSAKLYGVGSNEIIPQADFMASQNEHGGWTAKQSFVAQKGSMDNATVRGVFQTGARATDLDPNLELIFNFLRLVSIKEVSNRGDGWTVYQADYTGFYTATYDQTTGEETQYPTYSLRGTLEEAHFSEHPKWAALTDEQKFALGLLVSGESLLNWTNSQVGTWSEDGTFNPFTLAGSPITLSGDSLEFAKRIAQGKTTYKLGSFEWTKRWEGTTGMTAAQLNSLSHIVVPPGNPPTPNGTRDWMLTGANQEQTGPDDGLRFQNEITFLLSERGGWDSFLQDT